MNNLLPSPGQLFSWRYIDSPYTRQTEGNFYSALMCSWISMAGIHLCVGFFDSVIYWVANDRLYRTTVNLNRPPLEGKRAVFPCKI